MFLFQAVDRERRQKNRQSAYLMIFDDGVVWQTRDLHLSHNTLCLLSPYLCFFIVLKHDLFVYRDDSLTS